MTRPPGEPLGGYHPQRIVPSAEYVPAPPATADRTALVLAGAAMLTGLVALAVALAK
jgi:hypothetical protein